MQQTEDKTNEHRKVKRGSGSADDRLLRCAEEGNLAGVKCALEEGASLNCYYEYRNKDILRGGLPLHLAASGGSKEVFQYLLDLGANMNEKDVYGRLPLHLAAIGSNKEVLQLLLDLGANMNEKDGVLKNQSANVTLLYLKAKTFSLVFVMVNKSE